MVLELVSLVGLNFGFVFGYSCMILGRVILFSVFRVSIRNVRLIYLC